MKGKIVLLVLVLSFSLYVMDIISDIYVAVQHYRNGELWWCTMTLVFVLVPHFIINTYAAYINATFLWISPRKSFLMWVFQLSILASFRQEFIRWKREHWEKRTKNVAKKQHSVDVTLTMHHTFLCLVEAFAESAPQWCLQNYIMIRQWSFPWYTILSTVFSLLSLAWSITSLESSCKTCQWVEKGESKIVPKKSRVVFLVAHLFLLISRLTSLVIFAYVFRYWIFIVVGVHWLLVFAAICVGKKFGQSTRIIFFTKKGQRTEIRDRIKLTLLLNASLRAYPMVFCLSSSIAKLSFRQKIRKTFNFILMFYGIVILENTGMTCLSIWSNASEAVHIDVLRNIVPPLVFGGFTLGVLLLALYYGCCHPANALAKRCVDYNTTLERDNPKNDNKPTIEPFIITNNLIVDEKEM